jgi:hypothetical protein
MDQLKVASKIKHIGFISTRISGTDGVSLEIEKWAAIMESVRLKCFYFAGELDRPPEADSLACGEFDFQSVKSSSFQITLNGET